jgi:polysaccharide deacetylase 2 family uncharacterized protein YibQ
MARARRRRRKRVVIGFGITLLLVLALVILSPWGPLKGTLYGGARVGTRSSGTKAAQSKSSGTRSSRSAGDKGMPRAAASSTRPASTVRVEQLSDPTAPAVAIVVDDTGNSTEKLPLWLQVKAPLSFSVMPYPPLSQTLSGEFYNAGYQVMMHIPTQNSPPNSFSGKGQLSVGMTQNTVFTTLNSDLATVPHVTGINNHQGGLGCNDLLLMTYECEWAKQHGFFVVDSESSAHSKVAEAAVSLGLPHKINQVFIDHQNDPEYIRNAMRRLASMARARGFAIGICHYHRPNTATVVGEMIGELRAEGIHFAFARDINN